MGKMESISIDSIVIPEVRASSKFTPEQLEFFQATVKELGVVNPITIRPLLEGGYELVAGKTRLLEAQNQGATMIDAIVLEVDNKKALLMHLAENVARGSVDTISVAKVIRKLQEEGSDIPEISRILGKSETWVRRTLQLLELPEEYQDNIKDGKLTPTHVYLAAKLPTTYEMDEALKTAVRLEWNTPILQTYVENRVVQLERAREEAQKSGVPETPPPPVPQELVSYRQCLVCGYKKPKDQVTLQQVCDPCIKMVQYICGQLGPPEEAEKTIFHALRGYFSRAPIEETRQPGVT